MNPGLTVEFVAKLRDLDYAPNPGLSESEITGAEIRHGWTFPPAFREYLRLADGCAHGCYRGGTSGIWDFHRLDSHNDGTKPYVTARMDEAGWSEHGCFLFADALIELTAYGICLNPTSPLWGKVVLANYSAPADHLARSDEPPSFEDFMTEFLHDPEFSMPVM